MTDFKSLLAIIACSIMLFACGGAKSPEDVATEFITNIYDAKTDDAVSMLYLDEGKEADEKDMMTKKFNGMLPQQKKVIDEQAGGVKDIKASEAKLNDKKDEASVDVTVTFNKEFKGQSSKVESGKLKKVKDTWKVSIL